MTWLRRLLDYAAERWGARFGPPLTKCWECGRIVEGVGQLVCERCAERWRMRQGEEQGR